MRRKHARISVNHFGGEQNTSVVLERLILAGLPELSEWSQPERHDRHSFFLLEKGTITIEIDFEQHVISAPAAIYMHPDQVHRVLGFETVTVSAWALRDEQLQSELLTQLQSLVPVRPLELAKTAYQLIADSVTLGLQLAEQLPALLALQCQVLAALVIEHYGARSGGTQNRFEQVAKTFRQILAREYTRLKRVSDYAAALNLSAAYLNECVREVSGFPVSYHIQQRVILEAKRLLYHSDSSFKEIAASLGYDDYAYFSRLFKKINGISPSAFRRQNHDPSKFSSALA